MPTARQRGYKPPQKHNPGHEAAAIHHNHGPAAAHTYLARQNLAAPMPRSKALAQREGGITHLRQEPREAGIGREPRSAARERAAANRLVSEYERGPRVGNLGHALERVGDAYANNPVSRNPIVGRKGLLGGIEDLVKTADPIALAQTLAKTARHPLASRSATSLNAGVVVPGLGGRFSLKTPAVDVAATTKAVRPRVLPVKHDEVSNYSSVDLPLDEQSRLMPKNGFLYHSTSIGKLKQVAQEGLKPGKQRKGEVTGVYFGQDWADINGLRPGRRRSGDVILRVHPKNVKTEVTDIYEKGSGFEEHVSRDPVQPHHIEYLGHDDQWHPINRLLASPQEEVAGSLSAARRARAEQKKLYSQERSARVERGQQAMEEAGGGIAGFKAAMQEQRGELPKVTFERLRQGNLKTADVEALVRHAQNHPELSFWEKQNVTKALLDSFEHGRTPTPSEIKLLQTTYGQDAAAALARVSHLKKAGQIAVDVANIPRTVMASVDLSAPFRQGLVAGARHPSLFARNFKPMVKAFGSERVYQAVLDDIHARPTFPQMEEAGVKFTELGRDLGKREEQFISSKAEKIPLVRSSGRAYTAFLDKMRADMFDRQLELARKQGVNVEDRAQLKSIARVVNSATGRGDLGPVEQWAPALNAFFFSPRLIASRVNMLNPIWYASLSPFARKQALISMIRLGSVAAGVLGLGSYVGAKVTTDPRSADFAKLRIGNTRADVLGGFQQYIRVGAQLGSGKVISSTTGKTMTLGPGFGDLSRKDILERFVVGKFSPPPSFVYDFFKGTQYDGQPFSVKKAILARTVPLVLQDAHDLYKNSDSIPLALLGYSISAFGIGMQTYGQKKPKSKHYGGGRGGSDPLVGGSSSNPLLPSGGGSSNPYLP